MKTRLFLKAMALKNVKILHIIFPKENTILHNPRGTELQFFLHFLVRPLPVSQSVCYPCALQQPRKVKAASNFFMNSHNQGYNGCFLLLK